MLPSTPSRQLKAGWCSLRSATLIVSLLGASANFYATYKLLTTWYSVRWAWPGTEESEWEGLSWNVDSARALGALVCAYFFVGGIANVVGMYGVLKRRISNVRLFRDYSIADSAFGLTTAALFAFVSTKPVVRTMLCEELSRQPDMLRSLSDSAGLNVENCESFLQKAIVGLMLMVAVVLFIRLQFALTVTNYYTYLRRSHQYHLALASSSTPSSSSRRSHSHSRSNSIPIPLQRIVLLSEPLSLQDGDTLIYAPVRVPADQARTMNVRDAYLSMPLPPREGRIQLPIREGEPLMSEKTGSAMV